MKLKVIFSNAGMNDECQQINLVNVCFMILTYGSLTEVLNWKILKAKFDKTSDNQK